MVLQACAALDKDPVLSATLVERSCAAAIASARSKITGIEEELLKVSQLIDSTNTGGRGRSGPGTVDLQRTLHQRRAHLATHLATLQAKVSSQDAKAAAASQAAAAAMQAHMTAQAAQ